jgi:type IV pilus assembly protein PilC
MRFHYQARTKEGYVQSGIVDASSREAAVSILQSHGLYITFLREEKKPFLLTKELSIFQKISKKEIVLFFRQMAVLVKSKVPLVESLYTIAGQTKKQHFKEKIQTVAEKVESGVPLSQALASFPQIFSPFYINSIKSGEVAGKLSDVLTYLADHTEREYHFYSKVLGALIYPLFVLFVFIVILSLMLLLVVPNLGKLLLETGQNLPSLTIFVINFSIFFRKWWGLILFIFLFFVSALIFLFKSREGGIFLKRISLRIPFFGPFVRKIYLVRVAENLSVLISAGLPIVQAIDITREIVGNPVYEEIMLETRERVKRGEPISAILSGYPNDFPPLFTQMTSVGEKTGNLDSTLMNIVDLYSKEIDRFLDAFIRVLEPLLIIILGFLVAGLVASVILPLYQLQFV